MKHRRVVLIVEVETDEPLRWFSKNRISVLVDERWQDVLQVSANVVKAEKKRKGKR